MIRISLGRLGSGKTANEVREILISNTKTYTNIDTKIENTELLSSDMLIKNEIIDYKKTKKGTLEPVYKKSFNFDFWKNVEKPINVVLDEAHTIMNSRRSMSKSNIIISDWLAMMRRMLGQNDAGAGDLILISQSLVRLDSTARDLATQLRYHICHYKKKCLSCDNTWAENSEMPEQLRKCFECGKSNIIKFNFVIEIYRFNSIENYESWKIAKEKTYYRHYKVMDIEKYFGLYDTLQYDNLFANIYD